jgi:hypothetical protein
MGRRNIPMSSLLLGRTFCERLSYSFSATFRYQFVLSNEQRDLAPFLVRQCGSQFLYHCPELPVFTVSDTAGCRRAIILGQAVDGEGHLITQDQILHLGDDTGSSGAQLETWRRDLSGRHVVLICDPVSGAVVRVHVDTAASMGVVFDPSTALVASTLLLCLARDLDPNPNFAIADAVYGCAELKPLLPPPHPDLPAGGHSFGQTPDRIVRRILPNHFLSLPSCDVVRWRSAADLGDELEVAEAAERIVARLRQVMAGFMTGLDGYLSISGGRDSRMLLACAPPAAEARASLYTYANNFASSLDAQIAQEMAAEVGYPLISQVPPDGFRGSFFPRRKRSRRFAQRAALSTGLMHAGDAWWQRGYAHALPSGGAWMRGNFLEILNARTWPRGVLGETDTLDHIMHRAGVGIGNDDDRVKKREMAAEWRDTVADARGRNLHDFAYHELGVGHSQPMFHGFNQQFYLGPASDHQVFDIASRIDGRERRKSKLFDVMLSQARPSLSDLPYGKALMFRARRSNQDVRKLLEDELVIVRRKWER